MRELFERIRPSLRDYLYLCCSFKRYSSKRARYRDGAWNHHPSLVLRNELLES